MALPRDKPVRIWGWAEPEEKEKVEFGGKAYSCAADHPGEWSVDLDPMSANDQVFAATGAGFRKGEDHGRGQTGLERVSGKKRVGFRK